jgi:transketolase
MYDSYAAFLRYLSADMIFRSGGGHLSMPLGFADVMSVLVMKFLNYNPLEPKWFNRDRLVLSIGHGSALLYSFYFLAGYADCNLEDLRNFRKFGAKSSSHPEYRKFAATETTTGLLGEGLATAVGMAIAQKKYEALVGKDLCNYKIYVIVGDGCLMEGVSYEVSSLAGHLGLDNLVILFDDNRVTADGDTSLSVSENQILKFQALGFDAESIDGHNYSEIEAALSRAVKSPKPYFIACKTIPGFGTEQNDHMGKVSEDELIAFRNKAFDSSFSVVGISKYYVWQQRYIKASEVQKEMIASDNIFLSLQNSGEENISMRKASSLCLEQISENPRFIVGSADLGSSTCAKLKSLKEIKKGDFTGNYLNYGVREHGMASIMNGLALSGLTAIGSTYLSFSDYMRPAIRMAAMQQLPVIYFFSHDSIMVGEDGPTHQPIEHIDSLKLIPNVNFARPCSLSEMVESMNLALASNKPTIFALSRQEIILREYNSSKAEYVDFCIFASGSDVAIAREVGQKLSDLGKSTKVMSIPFWSSEMKIPNCNAKIKVAIETGTGMFWQRIIGNDGVIFNIRDFGLAGSSSEVLKYFGLIAEQVTIELEKLI